MRAVQLPAGVALALKSADKDASSDLQMLRLRPRSAQPHEESEDLITTTIEQQESTELCVPERKQPSESKQAAMGTLRPPVKELQQGDVTLSISFGARKGPSLHSLLIAHCMSSAVDA